MRLVFFGSSPFGLPTLDALARSHDLAAIVTQPDRPAGRGGKLRPTPVASWAQEHQPDVTLLKPPNVNEQATLNQLRDLGADAWVVIAFGQKLSKPLLDGIFAINLHASLLPRWRGAAPIQAAILAGDTETGNSVITLADRMDAGLVLAQDRMQIGPSETSADLHDRLSISGVPLIERVLEQHRSGEKEPQTQDETLVTHAAKITREDTWVRFTDSAESCRCRINGLAPKPGVSVGFRDLQTKLLRAQVDNDHVPDPNDEPGMIIDPAQGSVACAAGTVLTILEVQPAGKKPMPWADFARGQRIEPGERLIGA